MICPTGVATIHAAMAFVLAQIDAVNKSHEVELAAMPAAVVLLATPAACWADRKPVKDA